MTEFGEKLRFLRLRNNLRQKELAARTGLRASTISDLEAGKSTPRQRTKALLARALGLTLEEFEQASVTLCPAAPAANGKIDEVRPRDAGALLKDVAKGSSSPTALRQLLAEVPAVIWTTDEQLRVTASWRTVAADATGRLVPVSAGAPVRQRDAGAAGAPPDQRLALAAHEWVLRGESVSYTSTSRGRRWVTHLMPRAAPSGTVIGIVGLSYDASAGCATNGIAASTRLPACVLAEC